MEPKTPPRSAVDDRPTLPVSHPRSSPRSAPYDGAPQPPISPPKLPLPTLASGTSLASSPSSVSGAALSAMSSQTSLAESVAAAAADDAKSVTSQSSSSSTIRTPNVYINGLPPNFPEDQLYTMTAEFGPVISVRTFTRHVSDRPSGYGFVLFESVDSAEKCVESLRRYRNLHPSFSKQVHKIPGTAYANVPAASSPASDPVSSDTFKFRMERLKDSTSTNLYIEGLPLSIDEPTLGALIAPYAIKSSRFFQTRLSHPPRIIAFVRLESRQACEEIIERLHGRMVRGWNDTGSRISVRFADSAEQRELRRNERAGREGDSSPARLTMAQAALLSLRGQQASPAPAPSARLPPPIGTAGLNPLPSAMDRSQLPVHPMTAQYSQPGSLYSPTTPTAEINLPLVRSASAGIGGLTPLEQHLLLQAEIDAQRQALADLRLRADRRAAYQSEMIANSIQQPVGRPLSRLSALASKEFVPRGLAGLQQQQQRHQPQAGMTEDEFHQSARVPMQQFVGNGSAFSGDVAQSKVLYDSDEAAKLARAAAAFAMPPPPAHESHTRSSTLPPQLMHSVGESSAQTQARLNALLSPALRQSPNGASSPLNIAVPTPKQVPSAEGSPLLVPSPALTYNSSASSAALSPATPFFGSFTNGEDAFTAGGVYKGDGENHKAIHDAPTLNYGGVSVGLEQLRV